ncbi:MAG: C-GCAxxG-C-C family (seleno)protein [Kiritimatiellae bacterium]|nr:C-GCAxxG-C-C family (seleno)protein [Kiritimatiellia bacterium]
MPVERALVAYKKERLNCAQSVLRAFQQHKNIREDDIIAARRHGGGQAEKGLCGALHAALQLTDHLPVRQRLRDEFIAAAGSDRCLEIRHAARISCVGCVRLAANLLVKHGGADHVHSTGMKDKRP